MPVLEDLLDQGLDVVFCGTAAGPISARTGFYYANPTNKFYRTLHAAGFTDRVLEPKDYRLLLNFKIGLTDLNQIDSGMDHELSRSNFDVAALRAKILEAAPRCLAFTSKNGAKIFFGKSDIQYGEQPDGLGASRIFVLPSPSGAASGAWAQNQHHWAALKETLRLKTRA